MSLDVFLQLFSDSGGSRVQQDFKRQDITAQVSRGTPSISEDSAPHDKCQYSSVGHPEVASKGVDVDVGWACRSPGFHSRHVTSLQLSFVFILILSFIEPWPKCFKQDLNLA